jgi:hypothetical protein
MRKVPGTYTGQTLRPAPSLHLCPRPTLKAGVCAVQTPPPYPLRSFPLLHLNYKGIRTPFLTKKLQNIKVYVIGDETPSILFPITAREAKRILLSDEVYVRVGDQHLYKPFVKLQKPCY